MSAPAPEGRCLGLIGGLGPGATAHYYRQIVAGHEAQGRAARMLIAHADAARVYAAVNAKDYDGLARYLAGFSKDMAAAGAEFTAIVAATPHICAAQFKALSPLPLIDMLTEVADAVRAKGLKRVALLGTRYTLETRLFGQLPEAIMPKPDEIARIGQIYAELVAGRGSDADMDDLRGFARTFMTRDGAEAVILAGTDLSGVLTKDNCDFPIIDGARVHIDAILKRMMG